MAYEFTRDVKVEGETYRKGRRVEPGDIPDGSVASMLYVGWLVETDKPGGKRPPNKATPEPEPPPAKPKVKAKRKPILGK